MKSQWPNTIFKLQGTHIGASMLMYLRSRLTVTSANMRTVVVPLLIADDLVIIFSSVLMSSVIDNRAISNSHVLISSCIQPIVYRLCRLFSASGLKKMIF